MTGFIDHMYTPLETTSNYSATAYLHNSQITTGPAKLFVAYYIFTIRSLATASNSRDSSSSGAQIFPSPTLVQNFLPAISSTELDRHLFSPSLTELNCTQHSTLSVIFAASMGSSLYSLGADPTENTVSNNSSIVACVFVVAGTCLPSRCLVMEVSSGSVTPASRRHVTLFLGYLTFSSVSPLCSPERQQWFKKVVM
jgi:hypothetical protein